MISSLSITIPFLILLTNLLHPLQCQLIETVSVLENSEIDTVVYDLRDRLFSILPPEQLANVTAYAGQQDLFWPFALRDLKIVVARPLDREAICEKHRVPLSQQVGGPSHCPVYHCCQLLHVNVVASPTSPTQVIFIRVDVQDVNDNPPIFPHVEVPFATIPEDIAVGEKIPLPEATDADSRPYGVVEYRIARWIQGNASHFKLSLLNDQESVERFVETGRPYLSVVHPLDRESVELYEFVLEAIDGGGAGGKSDGRPFVGAVTIIFRVRDVNDNTPQFEEKVYNAMVQENTLPRKIIQFKVSDKDAGENGQVFVNIVDPTFKANSLFRLSLQPSHLPAPHYPQPVKHSPGSYYIGSLHLLEYLDAEKLPPKLKFHLVASDNGNPPLSSRAEVNIDLVNVNDQEPHIVFLREGKRLTTSRIVIPEVITAPESIVAEVHVTDADTSLGQLSCRVASSSGAFILTEVAPLTAGGGDADAGAGQFGNPHAISPFLFSSYRQYTLRTKIPLDREKAAMYIVTIMCTDNEISNPLTSNASLHISISDVNDETPVFEHPVYTGHVRENEANTPVTKLSPSSPLRVFDADVGRNALITFSLKDGPLISNSSTASEASRFRIDPRTGSLWSVAALDAEDNVEKYSFYVVATDDGVPEKRSSSALINILVDDMNDNQPEFQQYHYNFEVEENSPAGTVIGSVSVHDADRNEVNRRVRYALRGQPEDLFLVEIDRSSGQLVMRRPIDYEKQSTISLTVVAENEVPLVTTGLVSSTLGAYHSEASIIITIVNVNDNRPEFSPISPHRKHVIFIWEQLPEPPKNEDKIKPAETQHSTTQQHQLRICEPIPYKVIDKDCEQANQEFCCTLSIENTFNGTFGLVEEMPNVICALKRPPQPQSYKVTLIASDGKGNGSLTSQIQLSVIIKSGPDFSKIPPSGSPISSASGIKGDNRDSLSDGTSPGAVAGYRLGRGEGYARPHAPQVPHQGNYEKQHHAGGGGSGGTPSSSSQLKIISVLVSIAGILCVLLLFVAALKCGLLDGQYFSTTKTTENCRRIPTNRGGTLGSIPPKKQGSFVGATQGPENEEYRALGECFPDDVFCMDPQKLHHHHQHPKALGGAREGTYEISAPFSTTNTNTTGSNSDGSFTGGLLPQSYLGCSFQTIPKSPQVLQASTSCTQHPPMLITAYRPQTTSRSNNNRLPPHSTYLATNGRLMTTADGFYGNATETYQTLTPVLSLPTKGIWKNKEGCSGVGTMDSAKVTFNLEMGPVGQGNEERNNSTGEGLEQLLKNDILGDQQHRVGDEFRGEEKTQSVLVYAKPTHHASFV